MQFYTAEACAKTVNMRTWQPDLLPFPGPACVCMCAWVHGCVRVLGGGGGGSMALALGWLTFTLIGRLPAVFKKASTACSPNAQISCAHVCSSECAKGYSWIQVGLASLERFLEAALMTYLQGCGVGACGQWSCIPLSMNARTDKQLICNMHSSVRKHHCLCSRSTGQHLINLRARW